MNSIKSMPDKYLDAFWMLSLAGFGVFLSVLLLPILTQTYIASAIMSAAFLTLFALTSFEIIEREGTLL